MYIYIYIENKKLKIINKNFKVIATCKSGHELNIPKAFLSHFTIISCEPYNKNEKVFINPIIEDESLNEIKKQAPMLNLRQLFNCIRISKKLDKYILNEHENNLKLVLYILQKGLIIQKDAHTSELKQQLKIKLSEYENGKYPFEILRKLNSKEINI